MKILTRTIAQAIAITTFVSVTASVVIAEAPPLIDAVRYQDAVAVQSLLRNGADPDVVQADGATPLHWAVFREDVETVSALIAANADVNATNRLGASALYLAAKSGNNALIKRLLDAGANPNIALPMGETPLMTAARSGATEGVAHLIAAGADVNAKEKSRNQTALMWAAAQGHVEVARLLLDAGADIEARSKIRERLMFADAQNGAAFDVGVMEALGGYTPLLFAARRGDVDMGNLLLQYNVNIEAAAGNGASPLVVATHSGHGDFARLLLQSGANPDAMDAGYNALHAAVLRGDLETVVALLEHGADANVRVQRPNPIQRASEDWVLKTAHVSATPYWLAASFREPAIMRALVNGGADPLMTNKELWTQPETRADRESFTPEVRGGFLNAVQAAITGNSDRGRFYLIVNEDPVVEERLALEAVIVAAEHGVDVNHVDFNGSTALHDAAARNLATVVRELAERGANVNALNSRGLSVMDVALASAGRTLFYAPDLPVPEGPTVTEVLSEFGALKSSEL